MIGIRRHTINKLKQFKPSINVLIQSRFVETSNTKDGTSNAEVMERKKVEVSEPTKKKPQKPPFAKNLFLGKFDRDMLTYPEVLNRDRYEMLHEMIVPIEKFFKEEVDSKRIDAEARIPPETLQGLKDLGLYGLQVPEEYGGLGLNATEYSRLVEVLALDGSIAVTLSAHQTIGFKGILLNGSEAQKQKYLPRLAIGEWTAAFCLTETNSGSDAASIQTTAELTDDQKGFRLNGTKIWISNGGIADLMTVFARTSNPSRPKSEITAFIVERNFGGVTNGNPEDKMGIRGSNTAQVYFDNTYVPRENVLGEVGGGFKVAMNILNSGRFSMGSGCAGVLKELLKSSVEHAVTRTQFGHTLADFGLIKEKMARIAINTYAMESMTYLTAGLIDSYEDQDCSVEAAIVKVFSSEKIWEHTSDCLQVLGGSGYMRDYPYERILRDCRISHIFEGTNEILRLFIALSGLQHAGIELNSLVKKLRNPLMHPDFAVRTLMKRIRQRKDKPKLDMGLHEFVHPSLRESTDRLEYCTIKFALATEQFLGREGKNVTHPSNQFNVKRMADIAIDIYAMTAVLGRASRSYCIGVRNCDQEMLIANLFVHEAWERVRANFSHVSMYKNHVDVSLQKIADAMFENNGYMPQHPLTRTFW